MVFGPEIKQLNARDKRRKRIKRRGRGKEAERRDRGSGERGVWYY